MNEKYCDAAWEDFRRSFKGIFYAYIYNNYKAQLFAADFALMYNMGHEL